MQVQYFFKLEINTFELFCEWQLMVALLLDLKKMFCI